MATMKTKGVSFNLENENDRILFDHACKQSNFAKYVKDLIAQDIKKKTVIQTENGGVRIRID